MITVNTVVNVVNNPTNVEIKDTTPFVENTSNIEIESEDDHKVKTEYIDD